MQPALQSWNLRNLLAGHVRPLEERDVLPIARLHVRVYGGSKYSGRESALQDDLCKLFLRHPWHDKNMPSLVFEDSSGQVIGCIGVLPRPMVFNGRSITAAVSHSFMVAPDHRATLAALHLVQRFFAGPQQLSMADGNNSSRRLWEACGGSVSLLHSLCWTRPLRPSRYVLSFLKNRGMPAGVARLLQPFCGFVDAVTPFVSQTSFQPAEPVVSGEELDAGFLPNAMFKFGQDRQLRPEYTAASSAWLIDMLKGNRRFGEFHKVIVRNEADDSIGWYLYYMKPAGIAEVVQVVAARESMGAVLDHLFFQAKQAGAIAVCGQFDPALFQTLSDKHCVFHHNGNTNSWMLLHSKIPELLHAVESGRAFLTRLEREWWISSILG
jgi:hypothetical protein